MLDGLKVCMDVLQNTHMIVCVDNRAKVITAVIVLKE